MHNTNKTNKQQRITWSQDPPGASTTITTTTSEIGKKRFDLIEDTGVALYSHSVLCVFHLLLLFFVLRFISRMLNVNNFELVQGVWYVCARSNWRDICKFQKTDNWLRYKDISPLPRYNADVILCSLIDSDSIESIDRCCFVIFFWFTKCNWRRLTFYNFISYIDLFA